MSGLDIFVTKSYDKTLAKQRDKKMADKKLGITKDMQRYAAVSKKPKPVPLKKYPAKPKTNSEGKVIKPSPLKPYSPKPKYNAEGKLIKPVPLKRYTAEDLAKRKVAIDKAKASKMASKKVKPMSEAAKQLGVLTQPLSARHAAEAKKKAAVAAGRKASASTPAGRGASVAAAKKTTKGTVTRGKSNPVLDALRNAANSMTTNREKAINEKMWREGGNRPKTKPKGK